MSYVRLGGDKYTFSFYNQGAHEGRETIEQPLKGNEKETFSLMSVH